MSYHGNRLDHLARLIEAAANQVENALIHIRTETARSDSYPTSTPLAGPPTIEATTEPTYTEDDRCEATAADGLKCFNSRPCIDHDQQPDLSPTERAANQLWQLQANRAQIIDDIGALEQITASLLRVARYTQGIRMPGGKPRCYSDPGLDGYLEPRLDEQGNLLPIEIRGWSDPTCTNIPRNGRSGLCDPCRKRCSDWRQRHHKPELNDTQDLASEQIRVDDGTFGVAHVSLHLPREVPA